MSKGTMAKTKTEKGGKGSNVPTPAVAHEIVTGKFTDQDWLLMLDRDDGDEFITDIIEDLSSQVMDNIFVEYISRQLIPYTVLQAREAMVQIIQWQFLTTDKGETNIMEDPGWIADEEPIPATTDSWAQGAVPKLHMILSPLGEILEQADEPSEPQSSDELPEKLEMKEGQDDDEAEEAVEEAVEEATTAATDMDSLAAEESSVIREDPCIEIFQQDLTGEPRPSVPKKKPKKKFKPYTGIISSDSLSKILEPLERTEMEMLVRDLPLELVPSPEPGLLTMPASCQSLIKLQAGRPPGLKDVVYDEQGNVTAVARIELHKVPSRRVKTGFEIIDPMVEESQARLEAMRTGRYMGTLRPHPPPLPEAKKKSSRRYTLGTAKLGTALQIAAFSNMSKVKGSITPLPPPLIECMEVAPGVIVREGDRVKRGPKQRPKKQPGIFAMVKDLRPIAGKTLATSLTVSDLLDTSPPTVRSIPVAPSIPPIATHAT